MLAKLADHRTRLPIATALGLLADIVIFIVTLRGGMAVSEAHIVSFACATLADRRRRRIPVRRPRGCRQHGRWPPGTEALRSSARGKSGRALSAWRCARASHRLGLAGAVGNRIRGCGNRSSDASRDLARQLARDGYRVGRLRRAAAAGLQQPGRVAPRRDLLLELLTPPRSRLSRSSTDGGVADSRRHDAVR